MYNLLISFMLKFLVPGLRQEGAQYFTHRILTTLVLNETENFLHFRNQNFRQRSLDQGRRHRPSVRSTDQPQHQGRRRHSGNEGQPVGRFVSQL